MCLLLDMQAEKRQSDGELLVAQQRVEQLTAKAEQLQVSRSQEGKDLNALQAELSSLKGHVKSGQVSYLCRNLAALLALDWQHMPDCTGFVLLCLGQNPFGMLS